MKLAALVVGGLAAFVSMQAAAVTDEYNRTIATIGMSGNTAFVLFAEGLSTTCKFNSLYLGSTDTSAVRANLSLLIASRATGGKLAHVQYAADSNGQCFVSQLEIGP